MVKSNLLLYWAPGSFGDLIQRLLTEYGYNSTVDHPYIDQHGQTKYIPNPKFYVIRKDEWLFNVHHWSIDDLELVRSLCPVIIPTHRQDQIDHIVAFFGNDIRTVGINYESKHYNLVLRSWIKKVAQNDQMIAKFLEVHDAKLIKKFKDHGLYENYLIKKFTQYPPKHLSSCVGCTFDINIPIELLIQGNINSILQKFDLVLTDQVQKIFDEWYQKQVLFSDY